MTQSDPIRKAIRLMRRGGFRNVPIVDEEGGVVGCVRHKDIINYLAEHFPRTGAQPAAGSRSDRSRAGRGLSR